MRETEAITRYAESVRAAALNAEPISRVRFWRGALVALGAVCALGDFLSLNGIVARRSIAAAPRWKAPWLWLNHGIGVVVSFPFSFVRSCCFSAGRLLLRGRKTTLDRATHFRIAPRDWPTFSLNEQVVAQRGAEADVIIVPGFADPDFSGPLTPRGKQRCDLAAADFVLGRAPLILVSGGNVHPAGTPFNEAVEMRRYLVEALGLPAERVIAEPLARHTQTNLRNAGRIMQTLGLRRAIVVSDPIARGQPVMFQIPDCTGYGVQFRARWYNGVSLGRFKRIDDARTYFTPSEDVFCVLREALDDEP